MASFSDKNKVVTSNQAINLLESFKFAEKLLATEPAYLKANPAVKSKMETMKGQDANYLIHEYLAADFAPMTFDEMAGCLTPLNMNYVCSANITDDVGVLHFTEEHQKLLAEIKDVIFRETCKDLMVNRQFRSDYWIKGGSDEKIET